MAGYGDGPAFAAECGVWDYRDFAEIGDPFPRGIVSDVCVYVGEP